MRAATRLPSNCILLARAALMVALLLTLGMAGAASDDRAHGRIQGLIDDATRQGRVRVIVGLNAAADGLDGPARIAGELGLDLAASNARAFRHIPFVALDADAATLRALVGSTLIRGIERDSYSLPQLDTSVVQIGAAGPGGSWDLGYNGYGRTLAVLDSGVDRAHPALAGRVRAEACFSTPGLADDGVSTYTSLCPGGTATATGFGSGADCPTTLTNCGHGTLIAGTIAARDLVYRGVAPGARLVAVQIFVRVDGPLCNNLGFRNPCVVTRTSDQIAALEYIYDARAQHQTDAVVLSVGAELWGSEAECDAANPARKAAADLLVNAGIPVFSPTGNGGADGLILAPACISSVIGVGAVNNQDGVAAFSNTAPFMDFYAPGKAIRSTYPGGGFRNQDGTSMAAPQAAAVYALLRAATPDMTAAQRLDVLRATGVPITLGYSIPRVDIRAALNAAALLPVSPAKGAQGVDASAPVTYQWRPVNAALSYALTITNVKSGIAQAVVVGPDACGDDGAGGMICTATPSSIHRAGLTYRWVVKAATPGGTRPSKPRSFTVGVGSAATPLDPASGATLDAPPSAFIWAGQPGANEYRLIVQDTVTKAKLDLRRAAGEWCDGGDVTACAHALTPDQVAFFTAGGAYRWRVVSFGTLGAAPSGWAAFSLAAPALRQSGL